ncbi:MAG: hypothetical protein ACREQB_13310 [Candidatus Binataceae bacterium]
MRPPSASIALAMMLLAFASTLPGCGVKSAPIPPEEARPERILDLSAESVNDGVRLNWGRPRNYAGGKSLRDLGGFNVVRAEGQGGYQTLVEVPVTDQERFQVQRDFTFVDQNTQLGVDYRYVVISRTIDGYDSLPSNEITIRRSAPPPPPNPETFTLPTPTPIP